MSLSLGVYTAKGFSTSATTGATTGINTTAGSVIIVGVIWQDSLSPVPVITDSYGNTWTQVGTEFQTSGWPSFKTFYKNEGGTRGTSHTFTATRTNGYPSIFVQEVKGTNPVVDTVNTGNRDSTSPYQSNTYTPSVADEILLALASPFTTENPNVNVWGNSFAATGAEVLTNDFWQGTLGYRQVNSTSGVVAELSVGGTITEIGFQVLGVMETVSVNYTQLSATSNGGKPFKVVSQPISKPVRFQV